MLFFRYTSLKILAIAKAIPAFFALSNEKIATPNLGRLFITYSLNQNNMQIFSKISILLSFSFLIFSCSEQKVDTTEQSLEAESKSRLGSIDFKVS